MQVELVDFVALPTRDPARAVAWYRDVLGLEPLRFDEWKGGRVPFPSVRVSDSTIIDVVDGERSIGRGNVDHLCLVFEPTDLDVVRESGAFDVVEGPVTRWGARGNGTSLYVRDPDGNVVELRHYGGS